MSGSGLGAQIGCCEFDAFNIRGCGDGHLEHGLTLCGISEVGIGLVERTFHHGVSIARSLPASNVGQSNVGQVLQSNSRSREVSMKSFPEGILGGGVGPRAV